MESKKTKQTPYARIPGYNLGITQECEILSLDPYTLLPETDGIKVKLTINGVTDWFDKRWLMVFSWLRIPQFVHPRCVRFLRMPFGGKRFCWRAVFLKPYMYDDTHRYIPTFPRYAVSSTGEVIDTFKHKVIKHRYKRESDGQSTYPVVGLYYPPIHRSVDAKVHILVANTWLPPSSQSESRPYVNHKDGNKRNPNVENLEWCTLQENSRHAVQNHLCGFIRPCKLRNAKTGEILSFMTLKDAAKFIGNSSAIFRCVDAPEKNHLVNGEWEIRAEGDDRPWYYVNKCVEYGKSGSRYRYTVKEPDGTERVFYGTISIKKFYRVWHTVGDHGPINSPEIFIRTFKIKYPKYEISYEDLRPVSEVEIKDVDTGEVFEAPHADAAADKLNVSSSIVSRLLKSPRPHQYKHYLIRYKSNDPWPETWHKPKYLSKAR